MENWDWLQIQEAAQYSTDYCGSETANIVAHSDVTGMVAFALGNTVLACPAIVLHEYLESGKGLAVGKFEIRGALVENITFSLDGILLAVAAGQEIIILNVANLCSNDNDPLVFKSETEQFRGLYAYENKFLGLSTDNEILDWGPDQNPEKLITEKNVRAVYIDELSSQRYIATSDGISLYDKYGKKESSAQFSEPTVTYALKWLGNELWGLIGYTSGKIQIWIFQMQMSGPISWDQAWDIGDSIPQDARAGCEAEDIAAWMEYIPSRGLLLCTHNYHNRVEIFYEQENSFERYSGSIPLLPNSSYIRGISLIFSKYAKQQTKDIQFGTQNMTIAYPPILCIGTSSGQIITYELIDCRQEFINDSLVKQLPEFVTDVLQRTRIAPIKQEREQKMDSLDEQIEESKVPKDSPTIPEPSINPFKPIVNPFGPKKTQESKISTTPTKRDPLLGEQLKFEDKKVKTETPSKPTKPMQSPFTPKAPEESKIPAIQSKPDSAPVAENKSIPTPSKTSTQTSFQTPPPRMTPRRNPHPENSAKSPISEQQIRLLTRAQYSNFTDHMDELLASTDLAIQSLSDLPKVEDFQDIKNQQEKMQNEIIPRNDKEMEKVVGLSAVLELRQEIRDDIDSLLETHNKFTDEFKLPKYYAALTLPEPKPDPQLMQNFKDLEKLVNSTICKSEKISSQSDIYKTQASTCQGIVNAQVQPKTSHLMSKIPIRQLVERQRCKKREISPERAKSYLARRIQDLTARLGQLEDKTPASSSNSTPAKYSVQAVLDAPTSPFSIRITTELLHDPKISQDNFNRILTKHPRRFMKSTGKDAIASPSPGPKVQKEMPKIENSEDVKVEDEDPAPPLPNLNTSLTFGILSSTASARSKTFPLPEETKAPVKPEVLQSKGSPQAQFFDEAPKAQAASSFETPEVRPSFNRQSTGAGAFAVSVPSISQQSYSLQNVVTPDVRPSMHRQSPSAGPFAVTVPSNQSSPEVRPSVPRQASGPFAVSPSAAKAPTFVELMPGNQSSLQVRPNIQQATGPFSVSQQAAKAPTFADLMPKGPVNLNPGVPPTTFNL